MLLKLNVKYILYILAVTMYACNSSRIIKPLDKGETQIGANVGGPLISMDGIPLFIPLSSIYVAHGYREKTTAFASVQTTALLFGVLQTDLGFTHQLFAQKNKWLPGVSISPIANMMVDHWEGNFRFYPQLDLNVYWNYHNKPHYFYLTNNNWIELNATRSHNEKQPSNLLSTFGIGHQWRNAKYDVQLEVKHIAPTQSNQNIVVDYISTGQRGAYGIYLGLSRKF